MPTLEKREHYGSRQPTRQLYRSLQPYERESGYYPERGYPRGARCSEPVTVVVFAVVHRELYSSGDVLKREHI